MMLDNIMPHETLGSHMYELCEGYDQRKWEKILSKIP